METARTLEASVHHLCRGLEHGAQLLIGDIAERAPRGDARVPQRFRLPHVPDAGDDALVEYRVADLTRLRLRTEASEHRVELRRIREDVRTEVQWAPAVAPELENRPVPEHCLVLGTA